MDRPIDPFETNPPLPHRGAPGGGVMNTGGFGVRNETIEASNDPCADLRARIEELEAEVQRYVEHFEWGGNALTSRIETLEAERDRLREALKQIANYQGWDDKAGYAKSKTLRRYVGIARAALTQGEE